MTERFIAPSGVPYSIEFDRERKKTMGVKEDIEAMEDKESERVLNKAIDTLRKAKNTRCPWCSKDFIPGIERVQLYAKADGMPNVAVAVHRECWLMIQRSPTATGFSIEGKATPEVKIGQRWKYEDHTYTVASLRDDVLLSGPLPTRGTKRVTPAELRSKGEYLGERERAQKVTELMDVTELPTPEKATTDGEEPDGVTRGAPKPIDPKTGQHGAYYVLSEEERAQGFVRPVRNKYIHTVCGTETKMGDAIAETYARDPKFYGSTFCVGCGTHFPVGEHGDFVWSDTDEKVGT